MIQKILSGDKDHFTALVERHEQRVYRLCLSILADPHQAEEAAQEVFIKAYRSLDRFRGDSSFPTWLTRIGINHCKDLLRRKSRWRFFSLESLMEDGSKSFPEPAQGAPADLPEDQERAMKMLGLLPEGDRTILSLREVEGLKYEEIQETLGISLNAVKARLRRARLKLRHLFKENTV